MNFTSKKLSLLSSLAVALISFGLIACGDDSGTSGQTESSEVSVQVESQDNLPNCSKNRDGDIAEVLEEKKAYICDDGRWKFDHDILDSVKTEDDLSACLSKNEGDSVWVVKESAVFVCIDRKWEKHEKEESSKAEIPSYESEDDMPSCTKDREGNLAMVDKDVKLCTDKRWTDLGTAYSTPEDLPNCTSKRKDESVYIADEAQKLVCDGKKWQEDNSVEIPKSSSSKTAKSSSSTKATSSSGKATSSSGKASSSASSSNSKTSSSSKAGSSSSNKSDPPKSSATEIPSGAKGSVKDARDGQTYKTVKIGKDTWFAQNLNYDDGFAVCPMNEKKNCEKYGRLYKFSESRADEGSSVDNVCPSGWHVPDSLEWEALIAYVKANNDGEPVGVSLKASSGWYSEGDSVFIEGDVLWSRDSTRVGATKGTDRFGFAALPAGSCWETGCFVGDDARFFFVSVLEGAGYKLAFDKDELFYDKEGYYGYISVRCVQNAPLEMDPLPPVVAIDSLLWTAEDLSHSGSKEFLQRDLADACPKGFRIPTEAEFKSVINPNSTKLPLSTKERTYYWASGSSSNGGNINCTMNSCYYDSYAPSDMKKRHLRCVSDAAVASTVKSYTCSASEFNTKDSSVTWTVSGKGDGFKVSGYTWNFGESKDGVKISDNKATKKFTSAERVTPSVLVKGTVDVEGEKFDLNVAPVCPKIWGSPDNLIEFIRGIDNEVEIYAGATYKAYFECDDNLYGTDYVHLSCKFNSGNKESITINDTDYTGSYVILEDIAKQVCKDPIFTIKVSVDMRCSID